MRKTDEYTSLELDAAVDNLLALALQAATQAAAPDVPGVAAVGPETRAKHAAHSFEFFRVHEVLADYASNLVQ